MQNSWNNSISHFLQREHPISQEKGIKGGKCQGVMGLSDVQAVIGWITYWVIDFVRHFFFYRIVWGNQKVPLASIVCAACVTPAAILLYCALAFLYSSILNKDPNPNYSFVAYNQQGLVKTQWIQYLWRIKYGSLNGCLPCLGLSINDFTFLRGKGG